MRLLLAPKARPLAAALIFGAVSVLSSQALLYFEFQTIAISHCRKMNLQNIFFYNQTALSPRVEHNQNAPVLDGYILPAYCNAKLTAKEQLVVDKLLISRKVSMLDLDQLIRLYAHSYNASEEHMASIQLLLLLSLLSASLVSLLFQSLHLYEDSKEIDLDR